MDATENERTQFKMVFNILAILFIRVFRKNKTEIVGWNLNPACRFLFLHRPPLRYQLISYRDKHSKYNYLLHMAQWISCFAN